jgi:cytochrome c peroxidase
MLVVGRAPAQRNSASPQIRLGARLFADDRFSSPNGDLPSSCSHCHMFDEDPQGTRAYTDFLARSWVSWRSKDPRRDGLRNAPTILDAGDMPRLHYDGEFDSLEALVKGTLSGRALGWLPGEHDLAFEQVYRVLLNDAGESNNTGGAYRDQFKRAYGVELAKLSRDEAIELAVRSISDYVRTLKTERNSPYDRFTQANRLSAGPGQGEAIDAFAERTLATVSNLQASGLLKLPAGFGPRAVEGMKIFFRTRGDKSVGNCIACHAPPSFTDFSFHNIGVSQGEYDKIHGEGSFSALAVPAAREAVRPSVQFRETPSRARPGNCDLGYWNFVSLSRSTLRRAGESDDQFLDRMIATFKTPTLRNLSYSQPYMHNGAFATLESVLAEMARVSALARTGGVRGGDEQLSRIRITEEDFLALVDFLNSLNEDLKQSHRPRY